MKRRTWIGIFALTVATCIGGTVQADLIAQWLASDLDGAVANGGEVNEWPEKTTGEPVLLSPVNDVFRPEIENETPPIYAKGITPGGTDAVQFNIDGDEDQAIRTDGQVDSPVADVLDFSVAIVFQPLEEGEGVGQGEDFWRNTSLVDGDERGLHDDWGTSWRGTGEFYGGVGAGADQSVFTGVPGQEDLLEQWLVGVYSLNANDDLHSALLMAQDGEHGFEEVELIPSAIEREDWGISFAVQTPNGGNRSLHGSIAEVRFYDNAFDEAGSLALATELHNTHVLGLDGGAPRLEAGDADQDLDFDQLDLVQVQIAAKFLTGTAATWGEGDWNGAPGGEQGAPPAGNGLFDQLDIIAALSADKYLTGPYAALADAPGSETDDQTSLVYNPSNGELSVNPPVGKELTSINITSAGGNFIGDKPAVLDGAFDNFAADNIFKATFGGSFGEISFGNVLPAQLGRAEVTADLSAVGSLAGGGDLGEVDLIYVPEPSSLAIVACVLFALVRFRRQRQL